MNAGVMPARAGLHTRLVFMLIAPLVLLSIVSSVVDYRSAGDAALLRDSELLAMAPLLQDSVLTLGTDASQPLLVLLAPQVEEFLKATPQVTAFVITDMSGHHLYGDPWLDGVVPVKNIPEFHSEEHGAVTYRVMSLRVYASIGEVVVRLADGSDQRQQWGRALWWRVILPNLLLVVIAGFTINWTVRRALRPLIQLKLAVENRSPHDLNALDETESPEEVRPLVKSLNRLFGLVTEQARSQQRFVADAAHQLRTPLAGLQAQVEAWAQAVNRRTIMKNVRAEPTLELSAVDINKLLDATRRTSQLASQLLALSRADANHAKSQPMTRVDLKDVCEAVLEELFDTALRKEIDLGLEVEAAEVMGHKWLLRELAKNLTDNALKYVGQLRDGGRGGVVTLRCGCRDGRPFLEVEDDGPGICESERERVFERFYRVQGTIAEGNGLGLPIADEITRAHGGVLKLHTASSGVGLKVVALFPVLGPVAFTTV